MAHRGSLCSGEKSLLALAGQWKMQNVSTATHQLLRWRPANGIQVPPEIHQAHALLRSLEGGHRTDWSSSVYKLALTYFLNF